jgi:hypothetical protein
MNTRLALVAMLMVTGLSARAEEPGIREGMIRDRISSVAQVRQKGSNGSAWLVSRSGTRLYAVTNAHVIQDPNAFAELVGENWVAIAKPIAVEPSQDLALLAFDKLETQPYTKTASIEDLRVLELGEGEAAVGDEVAILGFPYGSTYMQVSVAVGQVSSPTSAHKYRLLEVDARASPGNSGGPALNQRGQVVGVLTAGIVGQRRNFLVPIPIVRQFLARHGVSPQPFVPPAWSNPSATRQRPGPLKDALAIVKRGTRVVGFVAAVASAPKGFVVQGGEALERTCGPSSASLPCEIELAGGGAEHYALASITGRRAIALVPAGKLKPATVVETAERLFQPVLPEPWSPVEDAYLEDVPAPRDMFPAFDTPDFDARGNVVAPGSPIVPGEPGPSEPLAPATSDVAGPSAAAAPAQAIAPAAVVATADVGGADAGGAALPSSGRRRGCGCHAIEGPFALLVLALLRCRRAAR